MNRQELDRLLREVQANHSKVKTSEIALDEMVSDVVEPITERASSDFGASHVKLYFVEPQEQIIIDLKQIQTIGRSHAKNAAYDGIDLAPFKASDYGISRNHASLALEQGNVILRDLDSLNGTFLNGMRLSPKHDYILRNEDVIKFGSLEAHIRF